MKKLGLFVFLFFLVSGRAFGDNPLVEATLILERWTSFHWGRDCLVWLVHYPEELVEPWVASEAARSGMSDAEKESYRRSFINDLRLAETEPFLMTVYVFGPRPLDLGAFASSVFLESGDGRRFSPLSYERKFDQPLSGVVQGLVFFPKQPDKEFSIIIRNLGIQDEQRFAFRSPVGDVVASAPQAEKEVVVVELPPAPKKEPAKPRAPQRESPAPSPPPAPPPVITPPELAELQPKPAPTPEIPASEEKKEPVVYIGKERTVENFVRYWIDGDTSAMYALLSSADRATLSEEQFASQVNATGLRSSLREGYKIQWLDEERVRIVTAQRMLLFRTLRSKLLSVGREDTLWKVSW